MHFSLLEDYKYANWGKRINRFLQFVLSLSLLFGLNFLASRHFTRIDLTLRHLYSLSPETVAYIRQIEKPVKIIVTFSPDSGYELETQLYRYLRNLLKEYEYSGRADKQNKIVVEFIDIYKERQKAEQLANQYGLEEPKMVLVVSEERQRMVLGTDLMDYTNNRATAFKGEHALTSAIIEVSQPRQSNIYFTVAHGEMRWDDVSPLRGLSQLAQQLKWRNFSLDSLDLTRSTEVPADADLVIVASPQGPFLAQESEALRNYLSKRAGRMIILLSAGRPHGLDDLLYEWGILADDMVVIDPGEDYQLTSREQLIRHFTDHPITGMLVKNNIPVVGGLSRPVRPDPAAALDDHLRTIPLLGSSSQSWAERAYLETDQAQYDPAVDLRGPVSIAAVSERKISSQLDIDISGGRLVVFGNADIAANQRISAPGNNILILNTINWCLDRNNMLAIPPRPVPNHQLLISRQEMFQLSWVLMILPGGIALLGIIVHTIRRH